MATKILTCTPKLLPADELVAAARTAVEHNPANRPRIEMLNLVAGEDEEAQIPVTPEHLAVMTTKYWGAKGVKLGVSFLDNPAADLKARLLSHMNAWGAFANVTFAESGQGEVRIARESDGYWSYLGTDVLHIDAGEATMNLEGFTMNTPESEYKRVVRHETGHTLGFPHEHLRAELVALLDEKKTIAYFRRTQGWNEQVVRQQVLTPISESSLLGSEGLHADATSIMCYQLPGSCTKSGQPIPGGTDIDPTDKVVAIRLYPKEVVQPPPAGDNMVDATKIVIPGWKVVKELVAGG